MKAASLKQIKDGLAVKDHQELIQYCIRMSKYKKENKELLSYLLFGTLDESSYFEEVKEEMSDQMSVVNKRNIYLAKKTVRKVLRYAQKHIKFTDNKSSVVEVLIHFCKLLKASGLPLYANSVLGNMYQRQLIIIEKTVEALHEDLQYDYEHDIASLYA